MHDLASGKQVLIVRFVSARADVPQHFLHGETLYVIWCLCAAPCALLHASMSQACRGTTLRINRPQNDHTWLLEGAYVLQEQDYGRARVHTQWGDEEEHIEEAVSMCPVDCISYVSCPSPHRLAKACSVMQGSACHASTCGKARYAMLACGGHAKACLTCLPCQYTTWSGLA